jgi:hypothetical protein
MFVVLPGDEEVLFATAVAIAASMCGTPTTGGGLTINGKHNVNFR